MLRINQIYCYIPWKQNLVKVKNENIQNLSWKICSELRIDIKKGNSFCFSSGTRVWNSCSPDFTALAQSVCLCVHI